MEVILMAMTQLLLEIDGLVAIAAAIPMLAGIGAGQILNRRNGCGGVCVFAAGCLRGGTGRQGQQHHSCQEHCKNSSHFSFLPFSF